MNLPYYYYIFFPTVLHAKGACLITQSIGSLRQYYSRRILSQRNFPSCPSGLYCTILFVLTLTTRMCRQALTSRWHKVEWGRFLDSREDRKTYRHCYGQDSCHVLPLILWLQSLFFHILCRPASIMAICSYILLHSFLDISRSF